MAIKITDSVYTDKGTTTELYVNIGSVTYDMDLGTVKIKTNTFLNKSHRDDNLNKCMTFIIKSEYQLYWTREELEGVNAFKLAYHKFTEELEKEFNTEQI
jgi:primase-polymerase (primpol)-like protein